MMKLIRFWAAGIDTFDSTGGHIVIAFALIVVGAVMLACQVPHGDDVLMGAFGALLALLRTTQSNHARQNGHDKA